MARKTGPKCKRCRRVGQQLFLKGIRCAGKTDQDCVGPPPGVHGTRRRGAPSRYADQLCEKQKIRFTYGVLEKQFYSYFKEALRQKGTTGSNLLLLLERRLDNVVYRMGFAYSRDHARQLVNHGFFLVNERNVDVASFLVKEGDKVSVKLHVGMRKRMIAIMERTEHVKVAEWFEVDREGLSGVFIRYPEREQIDLKVNEQAVVELYSR